MSKCIRVSGLPPNITEDKLVIYFQKSKNGGGDVAEVQIMDSGATAIVEFEDENIVGSVVRKHHALNGKTIKIERITGARKVFARIEATLSSEVANDLDDITEILEKFDRLKLKRSGTSYIVIAESIKDLHKFANAVKKTKSVGLSNINRGSRGHLRNVSDDSTDAWGEPIDQSPPPVTRQDRTSFRQHPGLFGQPEAAADCGTRRKIRAKSRPLPGMAIQFSQPEPTPCEPPFPQPENGTTDSMIDQEKRLISRIFTFPEGQIQVGGQQIYYPSCRCVVHLPEAPPGDVLNAMLDVAFKSLKLFYIGKNRIGPGFKIYSSYEMFGSDGNDVDLTGKLQDVIARMKDLGVTMPPPRIPESHDWKTFLSEDDAQAMDTTPPLQPQAAPPKIGPFKQPEGLVFNAEYHDKDWDGLKKTGSIHMYFRFSGGKIDSEHGPVLYLSYNRTTCLPGNEEGRKLYGMLRKAAEQRKLFVVAKKGESFLIRTKVELLHSDERPQPGYLQKLYGSLLKLGIEEPTGPTPLPPNVQRHYEEDSDEEVFGQGQLPKNGPHPQPENGKMKVEKAENQREGGFGGHGVIKIYFCFAGGKMKIEGFKPSRSFEIQHSPLYFTTSLPDTDEGRSLAVMIQSAFNEKKLFYVEKKDGEPSFRIRPHVHLSTIEEYPKVGYLKQLKKELTNIGIGEPSAQAVRSLTVSKPSNPQGTGVWNGVSPQPAIGKRDISPLKPPQPYPKLLAASVNAVPRKSGMATKRSLSTDSAEMSHKEDVCAICLVPLSEQKTKVLPCKHEFHDMCVDMATKERNKCPMCQQPLGGSSNQGPANISPLNGATGFSQYPPISFNNTGGDIGRVGDQPANGRMSHVIMQQSLPGYEGCGTIVITYSFPGGIQGSNHPHPGVPYNRTRRETYLPDNPEGRDLLHLLKRAFDARLTFTVGRSQSSGVDNQIIWNGIVHKTNWNGGKPCYGYPDPDYLMQLRLKLASLGIR